MEKRKKKERREFGKGYVSEFKVFFGLKLCEVVEMEEYCYDVGGRVYCDSVESIVEEFGELLGIRKKILEVLVECGRCESVEDCYEKYVWGGE